MSAPDSGLRRVLGPASATAVVVGAIVGVGIFFTPTSVARIAGDGNLAMWTWVLGGVVALLGALTFAELGGMYPLTAGQYEILRDAFGPLVGFCFVVCNATAIVAAGTAIIAIVCAENLAAMMGAAPSANALTALAALVLASAAAANIAGVKWGAAIQNTTVVAKVGTLLLVAALAVFAAPARQVDPVVGVDAAHESLGARLFAGLVPALFAYGGWQYALWVGGEVKDARRNVPLAIVLGVAIVVAVYTVANWAYLHLLGFDGVAGSGALAADAVSVAWPGAGARLIAAAVALSAFGVLNVQILSGPRLLYGMARDGRFFAVFGRAHARFATPAIAIAFVAAISVSLIVSAGKGGIDRLLTGLVLIDAVFFALTGAALLVLRRARPAAERPTRVPLYPFVPLVFVALECAIIYGAFQVEANRAAAWIGVLWIAAACACYGLFFRRRAA